MPGKDVAGERSRLRKEAAGERRCRGKKPPEKDAARGKRPPERRGSWGPDNREIVKEEDIGKDTGARKSETRQWRGMPGKRHQVSEDGGPRGKSVR